MAKSKTSAKQKVKAPDPTEVVVEYDLFELPTAFHKAGLAGLILLIESLKSRSALKTEEAEYNLTATKVTITATEKMLTALMNDLYDAKPVEVAVRNRWSGEEPVRSPTPAEKEAGTPFVYQVVQPIGQFLRDNYPEMDESKSWFKLWRDMLWNIPRGRPTTREPFNQRATGKPCKEGTNAWEMLLKVHKALSKQTFHLTEISSALLPGAQAVNAEGVPFEGRAEHNLLLHFWPLTVLVFAPQTVDRDGSTDFRGYSLAVPEVSNLVRFVRHYPKMIASLNRGLKPIQLARGYRPTRAVIDLPAEGALAFMDHLAAITHQAVEGSDLQHSIRAAEYLHQVKEGNNVKTLAAGRVAADEHLLQEYHALVFPDLARGDPLFRNSLFRRGLLQSLLDGNAPWFRHFGKTFTIFDAKVFIRQPRPSSPEEQKGPPEFATDAARRFLQDINHLRC